MKYVLMLLTFLTPLSTSASVTLANCDDTPYKVIVNSGGEKRVVLLSKYGGKIEVSGTPHLISFQLQEPSPDPIREQPIVKPLGPDHEFCIWSGKIRTQRLERSHTFRGGTAIR